MSLVLLTTSCIGNRDGSEEQLREAVDSFAVSYFNYDFMKARRFCTEESEKWLQYAASNVHQADIDILREQEEAASVNIEDLTITGDSTARVRISVHHFLRMDTIGKAGRMTDEATYALKAMIRQGKWYIRMEDLPRSEKPGRD